MSNEIYKVLPTAAGHLNVDEAATAHVRFRAYDVEDAKFILHSWLRSMRGMYRDATDEAYYKGAQARILKISAQEKTKVTIACDAEKLNYIYGWIVADQPTGEDNPMVVHYAFVKNSFRRQGIGTALLEAHGWHKEQQVLATHWNYYMKDIKRVVKTHYDPWLVDA